MNSKQQLKLMKIIVLVTILFNLLSFVTLKGFQTSIYPFFHWKLYTQPLGNNGIVPIYKLYGVTEQQDTIEIKNDGFQTFDQDDFYYLLSREVQQSEQDLDKSIIDLHSFGKEVAPEFSYYLVKEEEFEPLEHLKGNKEFSMKEILSTEYVR